MTAHSWVKKALDFPDFFYQLWRLLAAGSVHLDLAERHVDAFQPEGSLCSLSLKAVHLNRFLSHDPSLFGGHGRDHIRDRSGLLLIQVDDFKNPLTVFVLHFKTDDHGALQDTEKFQNQLIFRSQLPPRAKINILVNAIELDQTSRRTLEGISKTLKVMSSLSNLAPPPYGPAISTGLSISSAVAHLVSTLVDDDYELAFTGCLDTAYCTAPLEHAPGSRSLYTLTRARDIQLDFELVRKPLPTVAAAIGYLVCVRIVPHMPAGLVLSSKLFLKYEFVFGDRADRKETAFEAPLKNKHAEFTDIAGLQNLVVWTGRMTDPAEVPYRIGVSIKHRQADVELTVKAAAEVIKQAQRGLQAAAGPEAGVHIPSAPDQTAESILTEIYALQESSTSTSGVIHHQDGEIPIRIGPHQAFFRFLE